MFIKCDLSGARLHEANVSKSVFMECVLERVDFSRARMKGTACVQTRGDGATFRGADAENLRIVHECSFKAADFQEAKLPKSTLRGTPLVGAKFSKADIDETDLSECDLTGAEFYKTSARGARFVRANLTDAVLVAAALLDAIMQKANLQGADFTSAVLFGADMARTRGRPKSLEGANLGRVRVIERTSGG